MKIFCAFGYRPADAWVTTLVFPMIQAFDSQVVTGERLWGQGLTEQITSLIQGSDALIAFLTRRDPIGAGLYNTHHWVVQEAAAARQSRIRVLDVRETGIDPQIGMNQDRQRIEYAAERRDECISEIARVLIEWHKELVVQPHPLPMEAVTLIRRYRNDPSFRCTVVIRRDLRNSPPVDAEPVPGTPDVQYLHDAIEEQARIVRRSAV